MLTVAVPKRNKLPNIIVLTPKDGSCRRQERSYIISRHKSVLNNSQENSISFRPNALSYSLSYLRFFALPIMITPERGAKQ